MLCQAENIPLKLRLPLSPLLRASPWLPELLPQLAVGDVGVERTARWARLACGGEPAALRLPSCVSPQCSADTARGGRLNAAPAGCEGRR